VSQWQQLERELPNTPGKAQKLEYRQLMNNHNAKEELQAMQKKKFDLCFSSGGERSTKLSFQLCRGN
jgi:hypothetical protein